MLFWKKTDETQVGMNQKTYDRVSMRLPTKPLSPGKRKL